MNYQTKLNKIVLPKSLAIFDRTRENVFINFYSKNMFTIYAIKIFSICITIKRLQNHLRSTTVFTYIFRSFSNSVFYDDISLLNDYNHISEYSCHLVHTGYKQSLFAGCWHHYTLEFRLISN